MEEARDALNQETEKKQEQKQQEDVPSPQELAVKKLKNMSEEEIAEQASLVTKEVKEFSRTLDFDNFDKAKNLAHDFKLAEIKIVFPKIDTVEQYSDPRQFTFRSLAENKEIAETLSQLEIDQGNLNQDPFNTKFMVQFAESAKEAK